MTRLVTIIRNLTSVSGPSLDGRESASALPGIPVAVVYVMPYHLMDLLQAVPG